MGSLDQMTRPCISEVSMGNYKDSGKMKSALVAAQAVDKFVDCLLKFFRVFSTDIIVPAIR